MLSSTVDGLVMCRLKVTFTPWSVAETPWPPWAWHPTARAAPKSNGAQRSARCVDIFFSLRVRFNSAAFE
jgi:hypothetical protein